MQDRHIDKVRFTEASTSELENNRSEYIIGRGFTSLGGRQSTDKLLSVFPSPALFFPSPRVLEVGCGLGGNSFLIADYYGAYATALDDCHNMLNIARDRKQEQIHKVRIRVEFMHSQVVESDFPDNTFDLIYCRDKLLHIGQKSEVYAKFKPGGQLYVTEYMHGSNKAKADADWIEFQEDENISLWSVANYANMVARRGFEDVIVQDVTHELLSSFKRKIETMESFKESFVQTFSMWDYYDMMNDTYIQREAAENEVMMWGLLIAFKPKMT